MSHETEIPIVPVPYRKPTGVALASKGIDFVERTLGRRAPIVANVLIIAIVIFAVIGLLMALYVPLRSFFFEIVFVVLVVLILAGLAVVVVEAYGGSASAKRRARGTLVLLLFAVLFGFIMAGDTTILSIKRSASFAINYALLLLHGKAGLAEFVMNASGDGSHSEVNSSEQLSRFVRPVPESGNALELIGMSDNSVVDKPRFLRELTRNRLISLSGSVKVGAPGKNVIVLAAQTIRLAPGSEIQIGENDLILAASQFEANGASIRAFARKSMFHSFERNGAGTPGRPAGNIYLVLLNEPSKADVVIDSAGAPGGPGAAGKYGRDGADPPTPKVLETVPGNARGRLLQIFDGKVTPVLPNTALDPKIVIAIERRPDLERCAKQSCLFYYCEIPAAQGNRGEEGGNGEPGARGGDGGSGGSLRVIASEPSAKRIADRIVFDTRPSVGGAGGAPGLGGRGGLGGKGQGPDDYGACAPSAVGPVGREGTAAGPGGSGADGAPPRKIYDSLSMEIGLGRL